MKEIIAYVISYLKWIFAPENIRVNIFTLISVVLSGVVSWIISAIYFRFGNRNNLKSSVLYPMRTVLSDEPTWQRYKELTSLLKDHNARYLRKSERTTIDRLLSQYKDICRYDYEMVCAESLRSYFDYKLKKNGIDTKPVPVEIDGEIVDFDPPPDMLYFVDDMRNASTIIPQSMKKRVVAKRYCFSSSNMLKNATVMKTPDFSTMCPCTKYCVMPKTVLNGIENYLITTKLKVTF